MSVNVYNFRVYRGQTVNGQEIYGSICRETSPLKIAQSLDKTWSQAKKSNYLKMFIRARPPLYWIMVNGWRISAQKDESSGNIWLNMSWESKRVNGRGIYYVRTVAPYGGQGFYPNIFPDHLPIDQNLLRVRTKSDDKLKKATFWRRLSGPAPPPYWIMVNR